MLCSQATADKRPPARLIRRRLERYPRAALWGFPVDYERMLAGFKSAAPTNIDKEKYWSLLDDHVIRVLSELHEKCQEIWYSPTTSSKQVYLQGARTGEQTIVALVKSTRREDKFLPPPDKVEELKKVFAVRGFTEQPGWFVAMD